jgi:aspartyl-tRNA(Asn)/glutamyl-tRNA(Gln) amidotransferase subunit A
MAVVSYPVAALADLSITEAARLIGRGALSPLELTVSCLERIERLEPSLKAFITLDAPRALDQARALTDRPTRGPLYGIPIAIKDMIDVAGLPTTAASRVLAGNVATMDAPVVVRLREAGAVILGKTNTHEFAYGVVSEPTRNPWDLDRIPGGSSGGSAAAVAARMCPGAIGTDTAGSVRIPSALCGVTGLKPAPGSVPLTGIIPLSPSLDVCGPIARSASDVALLWNAMTASARTPAQAEPNLRVGAPGAPSEIAEIDVEVEAAVETMIESFLSAGAARVAVELPHLKEWDFPRSVPLMAEALVVHQEAGWYPDRADEYQRETRAAFEYATRLAASQLVSAYRSLEGLTARLLAALDDADVLILPTTPGPAPTVEEAVVDDDGHRPPVTRSLTRICGPINWCRLAAISVPCGFTAGGLPIGAQIIGPDEATVLGAGLLYQSITDWHLRRPGIAADGLIEA